MKKLKGLFWMMLAATMLTACSKDDDDVSPLTVNSLEGEYVGSATGTMVFITQTGEQQSQDVTPQGTETAVIKVDEATGTVTLTQPTFFVGKGAYPGAIVRNIPATLGDNVVTFAIKDYGSMNGVYTVAGDLSGEYKDNRLILDYTFKHAGQMIGTIHYEGVKK